MWLHSSRDRISLGVLLFSSVFAVLMFLPFSNDATSIGILPALSDFATGGRRRCLKPAPPKAGISPAFSRHALPQFKVEIPPIPA